MFVPHRNRTFLSAAFATLGLMYHVTVHNLRKQHRNAGMALLMEAMRSIVMIMGFLLTYYVIGVRSSPVRGDFIIYVMSGIFLYLTHIGAVGAVAGAGSVNSPILKHGPMSTAVLITANAVAALYRSTFSAFVILGLYYLLRPFELEDPVACYAMLLLAWASGCTVGLVFLAIGAWSPQFSSVLTLAYIRANMIASGKLFLANTVPAHILVFFTWNPLFHIIDQARGFAFINYTPHYSSVTYPIYVSLALMMIGLMAEFVTRRMASLSWTAGR